METKIENKSAKVYPVKSLPGQGAAEPQFNRVKKLEVRIESNLANDWQELRNYIHRRAQAITFDKEAVI